MKRRAKKTGKKAAAGHRTPRRRTAFSPAAPLVPAAVAYGVCSEVSGWLGHALPEDWVERLVIKAEVVAGRNARFRGLLRQPGDRGRDWLWAFMRHWLAALLKRQQPEWHARLPAEYNVGHPLPSP